MASGSHCDNVSTTSAPPGARALLSLAPHRAAQARRDRDVAVPHPPLGSLPHPPSGYLIGQQPAEGTARLRGSASGTVPALRASTGPPSWGSITSLVAAAESENLRSMRNEQPGSSPGCRHRIGFWTAWCELSSPTAPRPTARAHLTSERIQSRSAGANVIYYDHDTTLVLSLSRDELIMRRTFVSGIRHGLAQQAHECPQGERTRLFGADNPFDASGPTPGAPQRFAGQPGLADTGRSGDRHAGVVASTAQGAANDAVIRYHVPPAFRLGSLGDYTRCARMGGQFIPAFKEADEQCRRNSRVPHYAIGPPGLL